MSKEGKATERKRRGQVVDVTLTLVIIRQYSSRWNIEEVRLITGTARVKIATIDEDRHQHPLSSPEEGRQTRQQHQHAYNIEEGT